MRFSRLFFLYSPLEGAPSLSTKMPHYCLIQPTDAVRRYAEKYICSSWTLNLSSSNVKISKINTNVW